jgi:simple sugar transport system permease protein
MRLARAIEAALPPVLALLATAVLFAAFLGVSGADPREAYGLIWLGAFGTWFSWQNTLLRAAPLLLTGLCTALPAQLGLVIIGGEGAFVLGALAAAAVGLPLAAAGMAPVAVDGAMAIAAMAAGGAVIALAGALRHWRGVNETIASLLLAYIAVAVMNQLVEGVLRDPASLNKPSTRALPDALMLGAIPTGPLPIAGVHVGLLFGLLACLLAYGLIFHTTFGFAARMVGGNLRAARMAGLPVGRLILIVTALGGAAAGLAGMVEVAAVQGSASADIAAGYGFTGILVAFLARQNPLAIIPVAVLLGGIDASGGLLEQRLDLPDATIQVLRGLLFLSLLTAEALQGRLRLAGLLRWRRAPGVAQTVNATVSGR